MDETISKEFEAVEAAFNRAVVSNDVAAISACISEDWVLVTPEAGPVPREKFLQAVEQGILSHDSMSKDIHHVRVYDDVAVVTERGRNTGMFKGAPISADEWVTDVYVKSGDRWLCVLTHLAGDRRTRVMPDPALQPARYSGPHPLTRSAEFEHTRLFDHQI